MTNFTACVFDIETSGLDAIGSGFMLCAVIKPLGGRSKVIRLDEIHGCRPGQEKHLIEAVVAELSNYAIWIGHNIKGFDWPWIKSRCKFFDMPIPRGAFYYDTLHGFRRLGYKTVPNRIGKPSASLGHVVDFFGIPQEKTAIYPRFHWETVWQIKPKRIEAMDALVDHCVSDVRMTETVFNNLWPDDYSGKLARLS